MFLNLLLSGNGGPVADWISSSFPIIQTILIILIALCALAIIIAILVQPSKPAGGSNAIMGTSNESYYSQNKSSTKEGRLKKIIIVAAIAIFVLTILYFITFKVYSGR